MAQRDRTELAALLKKVENHRQRILELQKELSRLTQMIARVENKWSSATTGGVLTWWVPKLTSWCQQRRDRRCQHQPKRSELTEHHRVYLALDGGANISGGRQHATELRSLRIFKRRIATVIGGKCLGLTDGVVHLFEPVE